jgi:hypothetical protein
LFGFYVHSQGEKKPLLCKSGIFPGTLHVIDGNEPICVLDNNHRSDIEYPDTEGKLSHRCLLSTMVQESQDLRLIHLQPPNQCDHRLLRPHPEEALHPCRWSSVTFNSACDWTHGLGSRVQYPLRCHYVVLDYVYHCRSLLMRTNAWMKRFTRTVMIDLFYVANDVR